MYDHDHFAALNCPTQVTWTKDIKKMFTPLDIEHMAGLNVDLSSYRSVKIWASKIYERVQDGSMPPPGSGEQPWTTDMINTFGCWIQQGKPE
jgi:hypothetical protein